MRCDGNDTALATIRTEVVTNVVVDKVRSLDECHGGLGEPSYWTEHYH